MTKFAQMGSLTTPEMKVAYRAICSHDVQSGDLCLQMAWEAVAQYRLQTLCFQAGDSGDCMDTSADMHNWLVSTVVTADLICSKTATGSAFCLERARTLFTTVDNAVRNYSDAARLVPSLCDSQCTTKFAQMGSLATPEISAIARNMTLSCLKLGAQWCSSEILLMTDYMKTNPERTEQIVQTYCMPCKRMYIARAAFGLSYGHVCSHDVRTRDRCLHVVWQANDQYRLNSLCSETSDLENCMSALKLMGNQYGCCAAALVVFLPDSMRSRASLMLGNACGRPDNIDTADKTVLRLTIGNVHRDKVIAQWSSLAYSVSVNVKASVGVDDNEITDVHIGNGGSNESVVIVAEITPRSNAYTVEEVASDTALILKDKQFALDSLATASLLVDPLKPLEIDAEISVVGAAALHTPAWLMWLVFSSFAQMGSLATPEMNAIARSMTLSCLKRGAQWCSSDILITSDLIQNYPVRAKQIAKSYCTPCRRDQCLGVIWWADLQYKLRSLCSETSDYQDCMDKVIAQWISLVKSVSDNVGASVGVDHYEITDVQIENGDSKESVVIVAEITPLSNAYTVEEVASDAALILKDKQFALDSLATASLLVDPLKPLEIDAEISVVGAAALHTPAWLTWLAFSSYDHDTMVGTVVTADLICSKASSSQYCLQAAQGAFAVLKKGQNHSNAAQILSSLCDSQCTSKYTQMGSLGSRETLLIAQQLAVICLRRGNDMCVADYLVVQDISSTTKNNTAVAMGLCTPCIRLLMTRMSLRANYGQMCSRDVQSGAMCYQVAQDAAVEYRLDSACKSTSKPEDCYGVLKLARKQLGCCATALLEVLSIPNSMQANASAILGDACGKPSSVEEADKAVLRLTVSNVRRDEVIAQWASLVDDLNTSVALSLSVSPWEITGLRVDGSQPPGTDSIVLVVEITPMSSAYTAEQLVEDAAMLLKDGQLVLGGLVNASLLVDPYKPLDIDGDLSVKHAHGSLSGSGRLPGSSAVSSGTTPVVKSDNGATALGWHSWLVALALITMALL
eukprot:m51a1_g9353 hypothetical protein (1025) ;mRNA; r:124084-132540